MRKDVLQRAMRVESAVEEELAHVPDFIWDGRDLPVPVELIADSHYGLLVREEDGIGAMAGYAGGHVSGLLIPPRREIWVDGVEAHVAPARRRFTIGHEVGHWVLHCGSGASGTSTAPPYCRTETLREEAAVEEHDGKPEIPATSPYPVSEQEANQFSAAVLMPRGLVLEEYEWCHGEVPRMARVFGVSNRAMELRLWFLQRGRS